jgi:hypothetical protein
MESIKKQVSKLSHDFNTSWKMAQEIAYRKAAKCTLKHIEVLFTLPREEFDQQLIDYAGYLEREYALPSIRPTAYRNARSHYVQEGERTFVQKNIPVSQPLFEDISETSVCKPVENIGGHEIQSICPPHWWDDDNQCKICGDPKPEPLRGLIVPDSEFGKATNLYSEPVEKMVRCSESINCTYNALCDHHFNHKENKYCKGVCFQTQKLCECVPVIP